MVIWRSYEIVFTHYSCVSLFFNKGLCGSAFFTISFGRLVFHLSVLSMFFVLSQDLFIKILLYKKHALREILRFSEKSIYTEKCRTVNKQKSVKKVIK